MAATFRPGQAGKVTPGAQPAPNPAPVGAPGGTPGVNPVQAKFGGKQPAFLNAKSGGIDFGGTAYGVPKSSAAGTSSQPQLGMGSVATSATGISQPQTDGKSLNTQVNNTGGGGIGTKFQPKSPQGAAQSESKPAESVSKSQPVANTVQNVTGKQVTGVQIPAKASQDAPPADKQTNGVGAQAQPKVSKWGGGQGFGTQFKPKSTPTQEVPADGKTTLAQQKSTAGQSSGQNSVESTGKQQVNPFQKAQSFGQKETTINQQTVQNSNAKPPQEISAVQQAKPFGQKAGDQALGQSQQQPKPSQQIGQSLGQGYGQKAGEQSLGQAQQNQLQQFGKSFSQQKQPQLQQQPSPQNLAMKPTPQNPPAAQQVQKTAGGVPGEPQIQKVGVQQTIKVPEPQGLKSHGIKSPESQNAAAIKVQQSQNLAGKSPEQPLSAVTVKPQQQTQILGVKPQSVGQPAQQVPGVTGSQTPRSPVPPVVPPKPTTQVLQPSPQGPINGSAGPVARPEQVLKISPADAITFEGPFNALTSVELTLTNPTDKPVCYKVRSNAPHYYFVKPAGDLIEPHQHTSVYLMLQTPSGDRNPTTDDKHKFMIQSLIVQDRQSVSNGLERLWKSVRQEEIMETKIPCVFVDRPSPTPTFSSSYSADSYSRYETSTVEERKETGKSGGKKQKEEKSSSWIFFLLLPLLLAGVGFLAYQHMQGKLL